MPRPSQARRGDGVAVISEAATQVSNVKALVDLDALALEDGESNADIAQRFSNPGFLDALRPQSFPQADGTEGTEFFIDPAAFHSVFAADVPARVAAVMARAQRPLALAGDQEKSTAPARKTIPSWYLVGRQDRIFIAAARRFIGRARQCSHDRDQLVPGLVHVASRRGHEAHPPGCENGRVSAAKRYRACTTIRWSLAPTHGMASAELALRQADAPRCAPPAKAHRPARSPRAGSAAPPKL